MIPCFFARVTWKDSNGRVSDSIKAGAPHVLPQPPPQHPAGLQGVGAQLMSGREGTTGVIAALEGC